MRFFHQDEGAKVSTKCIRVSSTATTRDVLNTLIEKFRPDMRMLSLPEYSLYEVHVNGGRVLSLSFGSSGQCIDIGIIQSLLIALTLLRK